MYNCLFCNSESKSTHQKKNKYCSLKCQKDFQTKEKLDEWLMTGRLEGKHTQSPRWLKNYILAEQHGKCAKCGISDWQGSLLVLELEHKDGNSGNNRRDNLECLCPNCHSQTSTYKAKNKGNGRLHRRKEQCQF